ncbi:inositol monophosphatase family protein [Desertibaculum subflavum]|uniref:inositol monophosphatase family protein n=1 Tax=Desertibaculum subflavum TaxID=2268458 RepID=UPI000E6717BE
MADLQADHALLIEAVREAGALARVFFEGSFKTWEKYPDDPVSEADVAIDKLLHQRLYEARAGYGWLSEESDEHARDADRVWVVDPIDGTRAFIQRKPEFTVCAALVDQGRPVAAAVFNPATGEMYEAVAGGGARLNDKPIRASARPDLAGARLLASQRTFERNKWIEQTPGASFKYMNSIAYRMVKVAAGDFEAAISMTPKSDWDIAAAHLILEEAGARSTTVNGDELDFATLGTRHPSVLAAAPGVHDQLVGMLKGREQA